MAGSEDVSILRKDAPVLFFSLVPISQSAHTNNSTFFLLSVIRKIMNARHTIRIHMKGVISLDLDKSMH